MLKEQISDELGSMSANIPVFLKPDMFLDKLCNFMLRKRNSIFGEYCADLMKRAKAQPLRVYKNKLNDSTSDFIKSMIQFSNTAGNLASNEFHKLYENQHHSVVDSAQNAENSGLIIMNLSKDITAIAQASDFESSIQESLARPFESVSPANQNEAGFPQIKRGEHEEEEHGYKQRPNESSGIKMKRAQDAQSGKSYHPQGSVSFIGASEQVRMQQMKQNQSMGAQKREVKMELEEKRPSGIIEERNGTFIMKKKKDWVPENDQKAFESLMLEEDEPQKDEFEGDFSKSGGAQSYSSVARPQYEYESDESEDEKPKRKEVTERKMPSNFIQKTKMAIAGQIPKQKTDKMVFDPQAVPQNLSHAEMRLNALRQQHQREKRPDSDRIELISDHEDSMSNLSRLSDLKTNGLTRSSDLSRISGRVSRRTESSKLTNPLTPMSPAGKPDSSQSAINQRGKITIGGGNSSRESQGNLSSSGIPGGASLASPNMSIETPQNAGRREMEIHPMMQQQLFTHRVQRNNQEKKEKLDGSFRSDLETFF